MIGSVPGRFQGVRHEQPEDWPDVRLAKKGNCGRGCIPPGKTSQPNAKAEKAKGPKKSSK